MRSLISAISAASLLLTQVPTQAFAQTLSPAVKSVSAAVKPATDPTKLANQAQVIAGESKAFPKGGDLLRKRISDLVVKDPQLAVPLVRYVRSTPGLSYTQKLAAERGLADALKRMGIMAADLPMVTKAPPPVAAPVDYSWLAWLLLAGGVVGGLCLADVICDDDDTPGEPVSPN